MKKALSIFLSILVILCSCSCFAASALANNFSSRKLHESCGFRLVGYRERIAKDKHGNWQESIRMERRSEVVH